MVTIGSPEYTNMKFVRVWGGKQRRQMRLWFSSLIWTV